MVRINGLQPSKWTIEETDVGDVLLRNQDTGQEFTFQDAGELDVPTAPSSNTGVARKAETDALDQNKAPKDGGGTADLLNYASVDTDSASVTNGVTAGSVDTDDLRHGADVSNAYRIKQISPSASDVGSAVNTAISELSPEGGIVQLPPGRVPVATQIDLDLANAETPIMIRGHGANNYQSTTDAAGTMLQNEGVGAPLIQSDGKSYITLRDFSLSDRPADEDFDAIELGSAGFCRNLQIVNVITTGFDRGLYVSEPYGGRIDTVYIHGAERGAYFNMMNATTVRNLTIRNTHTNTHAATFDQGRGLDIQMLYLESNQGGALELTGTFREFDIHGLYLENNNRSGNAASGIHAGSGTSTTGWGTISGARGANSANPYGTARLLIDNNFATTWRGIALGSGDLILGGNNSDGRNNRYVNNKIPGTVDTTTGDPQELWSGNQLLGTVNKSANAVTDIGH